MGVRTAEEEDTATVRWGRDIGARVIRVISVIRVIGGTMKDVGEENENGEGKEDEASEEGG